MLAPIRSRKFSILRNKMDITVNNDPVNFHAIIESFCAYLNNRQFIEKLEYVHTLGQITTDDAEADSQGLQIPDNFSDSDDSSSDSPSDEGVSTSTLIGEKKNSFVRRLRRKLEFYILPHENENMPPVYVNIRLKKACLKHYFYIFNIAPEEFLPWFNPI